MLDVSDRNLCVVVLGVDHANTTITTRQLHVAGWHAGDADAEFAESVSVRHVNYDILLGLKLQKPCPLPIAPARRTLEALPRPWAVKDPRFIHTLRWWIPVMARYRPLLLWVCKPADAILASHARRGREYSGGWVRQEIAVAAESYRRWPWWKVQLQAQDIANASLLFSPARSTGLNVA